MKRQFSINKCFFFFTFNYISINLIFHRNIGKGKNEIGSVLMNIFVLGCVSKGECARLKNCKFQFRNWR